MRVRGEEGEERRREREKGSGENRGVERTGERRDESGNRRGGGSRGEGNMLKWSA